MDNKKKQELNKKRHLLIANSLYELGVEEDVIKQLQKLKWMIS